ncbi:MAG: hypothetical protein E3J43_08605 [Candidatus Heimdallarchaeota archaeon]|nr:MAG: hypothetical protein E3J43_08605 [Candidatus Heimdallarchaeota archaeon]
MSSNLGSSLGAGLSDFMRMLAERKAGQLQVNQQYQKDSQKSRGDLAGYISGFASDTGRKEIYGTEDYDAIHEESEPFLDQGYSAKEAARLGTLAYEKRAAEIEEAEEEAKAEEDPGKEHLQRLIESNKADREYVKDKFKKAGSGIKELFSPSQTEGNKDLEERTREKSKTAESLSEFTQGELLSLKPADIKNLPEEVQKEFWEIAPSLAKRSESVAKVAAIPFIGGELEKRFRESIDPDLAPPPPVATLSRLATELPLLGGLLGGAGKVAEGGLSLLKGGRALGAAGKLGAQSIAGAAVFGGDALANEAIRTLGTDKPFELKQTAVQGTVGAIFPYAGAALKGIAKPFRNAIARRMQKTGITGLQATEEILEKASEKGISIEKLQAGNKLEGERFSKILEKDASETAKKVRQLPVERAETAIESETRFAEKSKELEKTKLGKYLEKKKDPPVIAKRRAASETERLANEANIKRLTEERRMATVSSERSAINKSLDKAVENRYTIEFENKHGHKPLVSVAEDKAAKSALDLIGKVVNPTEKGLKDIIKNDKTMTTFLNRAKEELASGKFKGDVPDKYFKDFFINFHEANLKTYSNLKEDIVKQIRDPNSYISKTGNGEKLLGEIETRLVDTKNRLEVQIQKRKVLEQVKGPMGSFYKNWVDKLKGEQKLFTKDMIKVSRIMNPKEKSVTSAALKGMDKAERIALHKESKLAKLSKSMEEAREAKISGKQALKETEPTEYFKGMSSEEREAVREGKRIASEQSMKNMEKKGANVFDKGEKEFNQAAQEVGLTKKLATDVRASFKALRKRNTPKGMTFDEGRKYRRKHINIILTSATNQAAMGFVVGALDPVVKELTGKKIPSRIKYGILGGYGLSGKLGSTKPFLSISAYLTNEMLDSLREGRAKSRLKNERSPIKRRRIFEELKKKGFTSKQLKEIRS